MQANRQLHSKLIDVAIYAAIFTLIGFLAFATYQIGRIDGFQERVNNMAKTTEIEWCDSTVNESMGCDGCELWSRRLQIRKCYAGQLTDRYGGVAKGFPRAFDAPELFPGRIAKAAKWSDLTGEPRHKKTWLDGSPRLIFVGDMGDTFTESLPLDWLAPLLPVMADSPHIWMLLTKRPTRMLKFSESYPFPENVWPGTTVTSPRTVRRADSLRAVRGGGMKWISAEPLWGRITIPSLSEFGLVIMGGESDGDDPRRCEVEWFESLIADCREAGVSPFVKQLGSRAYLRGRRINLESSKGSDWTEWPHSVRSIHTREIPGVPV